MRIGAIRVKSQDEHEKAMYQDAAKRVVWQNCMASCDIAPETIPNFNANFYYNQLPQQQALQKCFNAKMMLHFGDTTCQQDGLYMDFEKMKVEYKRMEMWNPNRKVLSQYEHGFSEDKVTDITSSLLQKTRRANPNFHM